MKRAVANSPSPVAFSLQNRSSLQIVTDSDRQAQMSRPACESDAAKDVSKRARFRPSCSSHPCRPPASWARAFLIFPYTFVCVRDGYSSVTSTDDERAVLGSPVREGYLEQIRKTSQR